MAIASAKQKITLFSLLLSLVLGFLTFVYLNHLSQRQNQLYLMKVKAWQSLVPIVVAKRTLSPGTTIAREDVTVKTVPKVFVNKHNLRTIKQVLGAKVSAFVFEGEPVHKLRLKLKAMPVASQLIQKNKVALAVPADAVGGVVGGLRPSDYLDIFATDADSGRTELLAEKVRVLGVSSQEPFKMPNGQAEPTIILEVSQSLAKDIVAASFKGKLQFALRSSQNSYE